jgi:hypothetical protein
MAEEHLDRLASVRIGGTPSVSSLLNEKIFTGNCRGADGIIPSAVLEAVQQNPETAPV